MFYAVGCCCVLFNWLLLCSMLLVIAMFYLVGYCYVLFGWLLQCSINWLFQCSISLVIALHEFPNALIFDTVKIILLKCLYEFHMNVCVI
jgi:hypothetical protein